MPDIFTKKKRSDVMPRIRGAGNKATELRLIRIFRANGITGWRRGCSLALAPRSAKGQVASNGVQETRLKWGFLRRRLSRTVSLRMTAVRATLAGLPFKRRRW